VYGGGGRGLMGVLADAALAEGGEVVGIIPEFLKQLEVAHTGLTELIVVDGMQSRKEQLIGRGDAMIIMPGGLGTLDEFFEALTFKNLRLHAKPILICDILQWSAATLSALRSAVENGFADSTVLQAVEVLPSVAAVLTRLDRSGRPRLVS
jgi:uncharacterized protein (TIGR00730 family)